MINVQIIVKNAQKDLYNKFMIIIPISFYLRMKNIRLKYVINFQRAINHLLI